MPRRKGTPRSSTTIPPRAAILSRQPTMAGQRVPPALQARRSLPWLRRARLPRRPYPLSVRASAWEPLGCFRLRCGRLWRFGFRRLHGCLCHLRCRRCGPVGRRACGLGRRRFGRFRCFGHNLRRRLFGGGGFLCLFHDLFCRRIRCRGLAQHIIGAGRGTATGASSGVRTATSAGGSGSSGA